MVFDAVLGTKYLQRDINLNLIKQNNWSGDAKKRKIKPMFPNLVPNLNLKSKIDKKQPQNGGSKKRNLKAILYIAIGVIIYFIFKSEN